MYTTCMLAITKSSLLFKRKKNWQTSDEIYYYKGLKSLNLILSQCCEIKIQF